MAKKPKDELDKLLDNLDFKNLSANEITGPDGLLKELSKRMLERAMSAEIDDHLGYEKHQRSPESKKNHEMEQVKKLFLRISEMFLLIYLEIGMVNLNHK